jgi:hypothetical protein
VLYGAVVQREDRRVKYREALSWCRRLVALGLGLSDFSPPDALTSQVAHASC